MFVCGDHDDYVLGAAAESRGDRCVGNDRQAEQASGLEAIPDLRRDARRVLGSVTLRRHERAPAAGEAAGLTADRVDFLRRTVTIDRQLVTPPAGEPVFGPPKTQRSYRTIPLASVAIDGIARHIKTFGTGSDGLVLHEDGRRVRRQRFGQVWRQVRRRADLPAARFHNTRHTFAAVLLSGAVSVAAVAEYMGHRPVTLLKVYTHLIPGDHDRARDVVQAAFGAQSERMHKATAG